MKVNRFVVLNTSHPTPWLPRGRPRLACKEAMLDRVTIMASRIKPIWTPKMLWDNELELGVGGDG